MVITKMNSQAPTSYKLDPLGKEDEEHCLHEHTNDTSVLSILNINALVIFIPLLQPVTNYNFSASSGSDENELELYVCLLYTSPSPRD